VKIIVPPKQKMDKSHVLSALFLIYKMQTKKLHNSDSYTIVESYPIYRFIHIEEEQEEK